MLFLPRQSQNPAAKKRISTHKPPFKMSWTWKWLLLLILLAAFQTTPCSGWRRRRRVFQQCRCNANRVCKYELYRGNVLARVFQGIKCSNGCRKCSRYKCKKIGRRAKRRLVTYKCQL
ncbi:uncharacterized protein LOC141869881 [Acropora palmata]|uniref:uncharacterized protein LOC141869881 n=1 Tax=Acropora palmata TaxID=6131 RepID=UPI003DA0B2CD